MRFNVAQLLKEAVGSHRDYTLEEGFEPSWETGTTMVRGRISFVRTDVGIWVSGSAEANASNLCSRCLSPGESMVEFNLDEEYLATVDVTNGAPLKLREVKEGALVIDAHHTLDLAEAVRQYVIVNLPMKPLCRQNCAGLCPNCGANLNRSKCTCPAPVDSRWSPLLDLLPTGDKG